MFEAQVIWGYEIHDTYVIRVSTKEKLKELHWPVPDVSTITGNVLGKALLAKGWKFSTGTFDGVTKVVAKAPLGLFGLIWWKWVLIIIAVILLWWFGPKIIAALKGLFKR